VLKTSSRRDAPAHREDSMNRMMKALVAVGVLGMATSAGAAKQTKPVKLSKSQLASITAGTVPPGQQGQPPGQRGGNNNNGNNPPHTAP